MQSGTRDRGEPKGYDEQMDWYYNEHMKSLSAQIDDVCGKLDATITKLRTEVFLTNLEKHAKDFCSYFDSVSVEMYQDDSHDVFVLEERVMNELFFQMLENENKLEGDMQEPGTVNNYLNRMLLFVSDGWNFNYQKSLEGAFKFKNRPSQKSIDSF